MHCPLDHSSLTAEPLGKQVSYRCNTCSGIFLPGDYFREIHARATFEVHKRKASSIHPAEQHSRRIKCLHDANPMMSLSFKGVEIDVCSRCFGVWLDPGEFEKIKANIAPHKETDLSKIEAHIGPLAASNNTQDFDFSDIGDLVELVIDICSFISDLAS